MMHLSGRNLFLNLFVFGACLFQNHVGLVCGFVSPRSRCHLSPGAVPKVGIKGSRDTMVACPALPLLSAAGSFWIPQPSMVLSEAAESIVDETAFAGNDIDYFGDPLVQKIVAVFGVVVLLLLAANALFGQMDTAIEKVLVDFETVMKRDYTSRWVDIREQLDKLDNGMERQTKLFEIMEDLQKKDPELYSRVNEKMEKI